jgi:hypothetical protein
MVKLGEWLVIITQNYTILPKNPKKLLNNVRKPEDLLKKINLKVLILRLKRS